MILFAFSALFYALLFIKNIYHLKIYIRDTVLIIYQFASFGILLFGLESEKKNGTKAGEAAFFATAALLAAAARFAVESAAIIFDETLLLVFSFGTIFMMIFYEIVHWISRIFGHDFSLAGKNEIFQKPADVILTILISALGFGAGFAFSELTI